MKLLNILCSLIIVALAGCTTSPQYRLNENASVRTSDDLPENPLLLIPLTSSVNPADSTMSTLYGNKLAEQHARNTGGSSYPKGALLYEVTWKQQADSVWFGANIPGNIYMVERTFFNDQGMPEYDLFKGSPLKKIVSENEEQRIRLICSQRMAVSP